MDKVAYLKIYFPNGSFHTVRYTRSTTVADFIRVVLKGRFTSHELYYSSSFALRITYIDQEHKSKSPLSNQNNIKHKWLHATMTMEKIQMYYGNVDDSKLELRIRYFPSSIDIFANDKFASGFLYDQLRIDYMRLKSESTPINDAIELGSLEIRKLFRDLNSTVLDKKFNMDYLEKELGLRRFFPQSLIDSHKPRMLRKNIKTCLKKYDNLTEEECVKQFCIYLKNVWNWEQEIFTCNLGVEWSVPISLVVGPSDGIGYRTRQSNELTKMVTFDNILSICTTKVNSDDRGLLKLSIAGSSESLVISFSTFDEANDAAILIDGYCMYINKSPYSLWQSVVEEQDLLNTKFSLPSSYLLSRSSDATYSYPMHGDDYDDIDGDYAEVLSPEYEIDRKHIQMTDLLGNGQFGDVYRGVLKTVQQTELPIAIKTCKMQDVTTTEAFLDEAYVMQNFNHPHIIKLIGVCTELPVLLIMELAQFGELRSYLITHRPNFELVTLVRYCEQVSSALAYLESKKIVHRDIAARNILVSNHELVKLADFGLSRQLKFDDSYYKASKGKLPIKWMAPESINFRRFTHASDVWMFAVCMWETLTMGKKPFQDIHNADVIVQLENGIRLPLPGDYCPKSVYELMNECWSYEPAHRPNFLQIEARLKAILEYEQLNIHLKSGSQSLLTTANKPMDDNTSKTSHINTSVGDRLPTNKDQITSPNSQSNSQLSDDVHAKIKCSSSSLQAPEQVHNQDSQVKKAREELLTSLALLVCIFRSQAKKVIFAVLKLIRQSEADYINGVPLKYTRPSSPINNKEQMLLVRDIAITVRDLLLILEYVPRKFREVSEQRYDDLSDLVVSLIEKVRQRNYYQMGEHAISIAQITKALSDDILKLC